MPSRRDIIDGTCWNRGTAPGVGQNISGRWHATMGVLCRRHAPIGVMDRRHATIRVTYRRHATLGVLYRRHATLGVLYRQYVTLGVLYRPHATMGALLYLVLAKNILWTDGVPPPKNCRKQLYPISLHLTFILPYAYLFRKRYVRTYTYVSWVEVDPFSPGLGTSCSTYL